MTTGPIGEAYIQIKADATGLDEEVKQGLNEAFGKVTEQATKSADQIVEAMQKGSAKSVDELNKIGEGDSFGKLDDSAKNAGTKLDENIKTSVTKANEDLKGIGGGDTFANLGEGLKHALEGAGLLYSLQEIKHGITDSLQSFEDLQAQTRVTATVIQDSGGSFKGTAGQVTDMDAKLALLTGTSKETEIQASNLLLSFHGITSGVGSTAEGLSKVQTAAGDLSTVMGGDTASAAKLLGKALEDPATGLSKLTRVGVTFTDQQKEQIKSFEAAGNTAAAQSIIIGQVEGRFGGAAAAAANPIQQLKVATDELKESLGAGLAPAMTGIIGQLGPLLESIKEPLAALGGALGNAIGALAQALQPALAVLPGLFNQLNPLIEAMGQALNPIVSVIADLAGTVIPPFVSILSILLRAATPILNIFADGLSATFAALSPLLDALVGAFASLAPVFTKLAPIVAQIVDIFVNHFESIFKTLTPIIPQLAQALVQVGLAFGRILTALLPLIPPMLQLVELLLRDIGVPTLLLIAKAIGGIATAFADLVTHIPTGVLEGLAILIGATFIPELVAMAASAIAAGVAAVVAFASMAAGAVAAAIPVLLLAAPFILVGAALAGLVYLVVHNWDTIKKAITTAVKDVVDFVKQWWPLLLGIITGPFGLIIGAVVKFHTQIVDFFKRIWDDISHGVTSAWASIVDFFTKLPGRFVAALRDLGKIIGDVFTKAWDALTNSISGAFDGFVDYFTKLPGRFVQGLGNLASTIGQVFQNLWNDLTTGPVSIPAAFDGFVHFFEALPGRFVSALSNLASTIGNVFTGAMGTVKDAVSRGIDDVVGFFSNIGSRVLTGIENLGSMIAQGFKDTYNAAASLLHFHFGGFSLLGHQIIPSFDFGLPEWHHIGGIVGEQTGGAADEVLAILQRGEAVFTGNQQQALVKALTSGAGGDTYHITINANDRAGGKAAGNAFLETVQQRRVASAVRAA